MVFHLYPSFNLGKPAAIFDLTMGGKKLSFEPSSVLPWKENPGPFFSGGDINY